MSAPAISRHLRVLERAGMIEREVDAQWRICRLRGPGLRAAHDWIVPYRQFWEASLDRLADYLEQAPPPPTATRARPPRPAASTTRQPRRRNKP